jgi:hypothetical protein
MVKLLQFLKPLMNPWLFIRNGGSDMDRKDFVLAVFAAGGCAVQYSPVQVQKLFFLIDREIPDLVEGRHFNFEPYNYGPFDKAVYDELETLEYRGYVERTSQQTWWNYRLTADGQERGDKILESLHPEARDYIKRASEFVRRLSFNQLVLAIYKEYPEMRKNSVFQA